MKARVIVTLKSGVLDPQGQAIQGSLKALGFGGVQDVRQGKVFDIELTDGDAAAAEQSLRRMCDKLLANTVIENYAIELVAEKPAAAPEPPEQLNAPERPAAVVEPPAPDPAAPLVGEIPVDAKVRRPAPPPDGADLT
jgi:phosphoribosylformylglycinamidine synthase subunit PurS